MASMRRAHPRTSGHFTRHRSGWTDADDRGRWPFVGILGRAAKHSLPADPIVPAYLIPTMHSLHTSLRKQ